MCQTRTEPRVIGVTGGIGSGKSVVCRICALRGVPVYDCDREARILMDNSPAIRSALCEIVGRDLMAGGEIDRGFLASRLFASELIRLQVNVIVHAAVREHLAGWIDSAGAPVVIVESAVMHTSGLDCMVDAIWLVEAPQTLRLRRIMARNSLTLAQATARISAQQHEFDSLPPDKLHRIINDGTTPLLPRIDSLINLS